MADTNASPFVSGVLSLEDPVIAPNGQSYKAFFHDDWVVNGDTGAFLAAMRIDDDGLDYIANFTGSNVLAFFSVPEISVTNFLQIFDLTEMRGMQ